MQQKLIQLLNDVCCCLNLAKGHHFEDLWETHTFLESQVETHQAV